MNYAWTAKYVCYASVVQFIMDEENKDEDRIPYNGGCIAFAFCLHGMFFRLAKRP